MLTAIFDDALPGPLFDELKGRLFRLSDMSPYNLSSHWYSVDQTPRLLPEFVIRSVWSLLPMGEAVIGAEWFVQDIDPRCGYIWHFDTDRELVRSGRVIHPVWSTVLYFDESDAVTVVVDKRGTDIHHGVTTMPTAAVALQPAPNRFSIFSGNLLHGVSTSQSSKRRITMPLHWWAVRPKEPGCLDTPYAEDAFSILAASFSEHALSQAEPKRGQPEIVSGANVSTLLRRVPAPTRFCWHSIA